MALALAGNFETTDQNSGIVQTTDCLDSQYAHFVVDKTTNTTNMPKVITHEIPVGLTNAVPQMSTAVTQVVTKDAKKLLPIIITSRVPVPVHVTSDNSVHFLSMFINGKESTDNIQNIESAEIFTFSTEKKSEEVPAPLQKTTEDVTASKADKCNKDIAECEFSKPQRSSTPDIQYASSLNETIIAGNLNENKNVHQNKRICQSPQKFHYTMLKVGYLCSKNKKVIRLRMSHNKKKNIK